MVGFLGRTVLPYRRMPKSTLCIIVIFFKFVHKHNLYIIIYVTPTQFKSKNLYVFIDSSNLWAVQKSKGKMFDYEKLRNVVQKKFSASKIKIFYYTAYPSDGTRNYNLDSKHKFFVFLEKRLGFVVVKKPLKRISIHSELGDITQEKGNMDVEMTMDAMRFSDVYDSAVFFTGDSDFLALITYLRNKHKKVYVFSSKNNVSQELRTGADGYFDVLLMDEDLWGRELKHRDQ